MTDVTKYSTEELLRRYANGDIDSRAEAELLRRARMDEATASAMEGYLAHPEADHAAAMRRIKGKLPRKQRTSLAGKLSMAASIAVLLAVGIWLWPQFSGDAAMAKSEATPMASNEGPAQEEAEVDLSAESEDVELLQEPPPIAAPLAKQKTAATNQNAAKEMAERKEREAAQKKVAARQETDIRKDAIAQQADQLNGEVTDDEDVLAEEEIIVDNIAAPTLPIEYEEGVSDQSGGSTPQVEPEIAAAAPASPAPAAVRTFTTKRRVISGFVTDEQDRPVNRANITLPGQPIGEYTDSTGYFELVADKTISQFEVGHPDFEATNIVLPRDEDEVMINLSRNLPLGFSDEREQADPFFNGASTTIYPNEEKTYAMPRNGMRQLRLDIQNAKPAELPGGIVKVSFSVQADGSLTNLDFNKKSEPALIDFVRNYLQQESEWELRGGTKATRMVVTFRF